MTVAVVTGAAQGIGQRIAEVLAQAGYQLALIDLQPTHRDGALSLAGDVSSEQDVSDAARAVLDAYGRIDVLVNNAGIACISPAEQTPPQLWRRVLEVNLTGPFLLCQAFGPAMLAQRSGSIVNISSGAGLGVSLTGIQAYASAKAAQIGLTRQLAHELGPFGITVNSIAPGFVRSNPTTERQWESYGEAGQRKLVESIALKRLGSPEDIAHAVMFFASDYAGWITGQVLSVDGGK